MEIWIPFNLLTFTLFLSFTFFLLRLCKKNKGRTKPENLPPGPPKLPLIGNLHHLLLLGGLPHYVFHLLARKYGPVLHIQLGQVSTVVISSPEAAKEVLKTQDPACADRPESIATKIMFYNHLEIVFSPYNERWRQMRKICILELLTAKNVKSFDSIRQDEVLRFVKSLRSSSGLPTNLTEKIFEFTSSFTSRVVFGTVVVEKRERMLVMMKKAMEMSGGFEVADFFPSSELLRALSRYKLMRVRRKLDEILDVVLEEHRLKVYGEFCGEDIVDVFLRMQRNEELEFPITDDCIKGIIFDMFTGGSNTSSTVLDWAMAEIMRNPGVMAKAQAEIREAVSGKKTVEGSDIRKLKYLKLVIKETLRLHPPLPLITRACRDECKVNGYTIPLKSRVFVNAWSMGRDPEYWPDPENFQPERFENSTIDFLGNSFEFIPFGAGKRICPGISFGLANVELPLAQLLYHFDWEMPKGMIAPDDVDMTETKGLDARRKNNLFLVPVAYDHPNGN